MTPFTLALHWYKKHGRVLPWRKTRDPYRILLSEIMLQQTQVDRVIIYYERWLKCFPHWRSLAKAKKSEVIRAWSGLGYNRRALFLKAAAEAVVTSGIPESEEDWQKLKGVGLYTARAISAFSQKKRTLPIDTNIRRVLARVLFGKPFPNEQDDRAIETKAMEQFPTRGTYYDVPQALFDIASLYCTKTPNCADCPLKKHCLAGPKFLAGKVPIPKRSIKKANENIRAGKRFPDRIYRGRILQLLQKMNRANIKQLGKKIDPTFTPVDQIWLEQLLQRLAKDELITWEKTTVSLPKT